MPSDNEPAWPPVRRRVRPRRFSRCFPRPSRALPLRGAVAMERRTLITSSSNPRLKTIRRLRRGRDGAFLIEGFRQVSCAVEAGVRIRELVLAPELWLGTSEAEL